MVLIPWKDSYSVGVADIDYEHREMIDLINDLHERLADKADDLDASAFLGKIFQAISLHFALEERFMQEHGYDQFRQHKNAHERLLDEIRDIMDDYEAAPERASIELSRQLDLWFTDHFKTHDARLHHRLGNHDHH
ncbi:MAG: hemerythrin family protein [Rhizobiales bacterium]|nr:hemerythrin family protein [Hyphomicrobiales bacterium]